MKWWGKGDRNSGFKLLKNEVEEKTVSEIPKKRERRHGKLESPDGASCLRQRELDLEMKVFFFPRSLWRIY